MKKPEITKGEWEISDNGTVFHWGNGPETEGYTPCIAKVSIWKNNPEKGLANARAISAVPEMIDALVEARNEIKTMENCLTMNHHKYDVTAITVINKALKKAGCGE